MSFQHSSGKWGARISRNGKRISLGYFDTKEEADQKEATAKNVALVVEPKKTFTSLKVKKNRKDVYKNKTNTIHNDIVKKCLNYGFSKELFTNNLLKNVRFNEFLICDGCGVHPRFTTHNKENIYSHNQHVSCNTYYKCNCVDDWILLSDEDIEFVPDLHLIQRLTNSSPRLILIEVEISNKIDHNKLDKLQLLASWLDSESWFFDVYSIDQYGNFYEVDISNNDMISNHKRIGNIEECLDIISSGRYNPTKDYAFECFFEDFGRDNHVHQ